MNKFEKVVQTDFEKQKGANVQIIGDEGSALLNVWADIIDNDDPRFFVTLNNDNELLIVNVDTSEFKLPDISFSDDRTYCYLKFNKCQVHIKLEGEGVVIDVWDMTDPTEEEVINSTYSYWSEL